jgi:hypothetical protein
MAMRYDPASLASALSRMTGRGTFTVHGHRLSSLFRLYTKPQNPFIVLKILKKFAQSRPWDLSIFGTVKAGAT